MILLIGISQLSKLRLEVFSQNNAFFNCVIIALVTADWLIAGKLLKLLNCMHYYMLIKHFHKLPKSSMSITHVCFQTSIETFCIVIGFVIQAINTESFWGHYIEPIPLKYLLKASSLLLISPLNVAISITRDPQATKILFAGRRQSAITFRAHFFT